MSPRDWKERIQDILEAIDEIRIFIAGMDFAEFSADVKTMKAVELNLIVIGEATNQIPEDILEENPQVPWGLMRAMRNRLVHVYFSIDARILWDTAKKDLPELEIALKRLFN